MPSMPWSAALVLLGGIQLFLKPNMDFTILAKIDKANCLSALFL